MLSKRQLFGSLRYYETNNKESIWLCENIRSRYRDLVVDYGEYGNIFGLLFHDLMIHFTGILIQRESIKDYGDFDHHIYANELPFPFVSKQYACDPYSLPESSYRVTLDRHLSVASLVSQFPLLPIGVGDSVHLDRNKYSISRRVFSLLTAKHKFTLVYLPDLHRQVDLLKSAIVDWCKRYKINNVGIVLGNWSRYIDLNACQNQATITNRGLIVGTRALIQNRKLAINYLQQGKPVLGFTHGEINNTVFDEPFFGYSEMSLCSVLLDYGEKRLGYNLNQPLAKPIKLLARSSKEVGKIIGASNVIRYKKSAMSKKLYIPTSYTGNYHYGPFRSYEDIVYTHWQSCLVGAIDNLTFKAHPKSPQPKFETSMEMRWLEECVSEYDVLILDYYSTAATIAIFTDKPVIYFDIGLRNINKSYMQLLKERFYYCEIDLYGDIHEQIECTLKSYLDSKLPCTNDSFKEFSIRSDKAEGIVSAIQGTFYK